MPVQHGQTRRPGTSARRPTDEGSEWSGHERGSRGYRRIIAGSACLGVGTFAQLYAPQGVLAIVSHRLGVSAASSALLVSAATIGIAVGVLPWSAVADRIGRLAAMRWSVGAAALFGIAAAFVPSFGEILVGRFLSGVALAGVPAVAVAYLQEEVSASSAAVAAATYVSGTTLGGLSGRLIAAGVASVIGWRGGIAVAVIAATAANLAFILVVPAARGFRPTGTSAAAQMLSHAWANLRSPGLLVLYAQAFLLMGGFVTVYNYLAFRLIRAPFGLSPTLASLIFIAYLAGTASSRVAGGLTLRFGRAAVMIVAALAMVAGVLATLSSALGVVLAGLVLATFGFFGAHAVASGWVAARAPVGRAQATSLYNLFYYLGSSVLGYVGGIVFTAADWDGTVAYVAGLVGLALAAALAGILAPGRR